MRAIVIGANGQLGHDLVRAFDGWNVAALTHADVEVCDPSSVRRALDQWQPEVVINTAAFHKVDVCEDEVEKSFAVNAFAVRDLARCCTERGCTLVHLSTDYVFGSNKRTPHVETDIPHPVNVYGASKAAGEQFIRYTCPRHFLVRVSGLYGVAGSSGKGGNFVELMVRLAKEGKPIRVVNDQVLTPTYTADLAHALRRLIQTDAYGTYHLTSAGECSWYEFAGTIFRLLGMQPDFAPTTTASFPTKAQRPVYSVLDNAAFRRVLGWDLRPWTEALADYLRAKGHLCTTVRRAA